MQHPQSISPRYRRLVTCLWTALGLDLRLVNLRQRVRGHEENKKARTRLLQYGLIAEGYFGYSVRDAAAALRGWSGLVNLIGLRCSVCRSTSLINLTTIAILPGTLAKFKEILEIRR